MIDSKYALRKESHKRRDSIDPALRMAYSQIIDNYVSALVPPSSVNAIHCYISYLSEVDTQRILKTYLAEGVVVSVPYLSTPDDAAFINARYDGDGTLIKGPYSILQPKICIPVPPSTLDAVFIPVLAFDGFGTRLGYGKGYYDKFLSQLPRSARKVGLAFSIQEYDELPVDANDVPLDVIVTEQGIITASRR